MNNFLIRYFGKAWMALTFLFLYLPLMFMIVFSFNSTRQDAEFTGFSLRWYEALTKDTKIVEGFWLSLQVATFSGIASAVLATFAAFVLVRYRRFRGRTLFSGMVNAPLVMPEVVIGLSLLLLMVGIQNAFDWPQRGMLTIVLGHTLLGVPYVVLIMSVAIRSFDSRIEEVAFTLGASWFTMFRRVLIPNLLPSTAAAWIFAFVTSFDEVVITSFIGGTHETVPKRMFNDLVLQVNPSITAIATLLILGSVALMALAAALVRRSRLAAALPAL